ncbi:MAG: hypothetical protein ACXU8U_05775 [Asticcacaulis sp.]
MDDTSYNYTHSRPQPVPRNAPSHTPVTRRFHRGDEVTVRPAAEILATLDGKGACDGVMFMPEMADMIGRAFRVHRRAERTCVEGHGFRSLKDAVFLEAARCDGAAHDGCQRDCLLFWHESWLQPADTPRRPFDHMTEARALAELYALPVRDGDRFVCQSTRLAEATQPLSKLHFGALVKAVGDGDMTLGGFASIAGRAVVNRVREATGLPQLGMILGQPGRKSRGELDLQPGDWVRIRDSETIRATLDQEGRNLGLSFEPEMAMLIGQVRQVDRIIERMIHEETGKMVRLARTVKLKDTYCQGLCSKLCPRANPLFWREAWLERVPAPSEARGS